MTADTLAAKAGMEVIACPKCDARLMFCRSGSPTIDACGFESYSFGCGECGTPLAGIVDPSDDTLLLCVPPDDGDVREPFTAEAPAYGEADRDWQAPPLGERADSAPAAEWPTAPARRHVEAA